MGRRAGSQTDGVSFVAVAKAFVLPAITRRRGNPNWGRPIQPLPAVATESEMQVRQLRLTMQNLCQFNRVT